MRSAKAATVKGDAALLQTLRKAQGMLRQLSQEKEELETTNAKLDEQLRSLQTKLAEAENRTAQLRRLQPLLDEQRRQNEGLRERIETDATKLHEASRKGATMTQELARWRRDNGLLVEAVAERARWGKACKGKNAELLRVNREMLERFADRGFWDKLRTADPLTGLRSVAVENARDEFAFRLEDLEVTPWRESPNGSHPGAATDPVEEGENEDDG